MKKNFEELADRVHRFMVSNSIYEGWTLTALSDKMGIGHTDLTGALFLLLRQGRVTNRIPAPRQMVRWFAVKPSTHIDNGC